MSASKKGAGPNAGSKQSRRVEKLFNKMAARLEEAGDVCRDKGGGRACVVFDVTAGVLKRTPSVMAAVDAESQAQQDRSEPSSVTRPTAESTGKKATPEKTVPIGTGNAAVKTTEEKAGETVAKARTKKVASVEPVVETVESTEPLGDDDPALDDA